VKTQLILASQSPARRRLLKRLGLKFLCRPAHLDEAAVQRRISNPKKLVLELSKLKARAVASLYPSAIVIGGDQVLVCGGRIFGKPHTESRAIAQLKAMSGKTVQLMTGYCILAADGFEVAAVHQTRLKLRRLSTQEIKDYVRRDNPLECSGSFKFESFGIGLFEAIRTDDPTAIEGLPLLAIGRTLRRISDRHS
jgi:septum formation protein